MSTMVYMYVVYCKRLCRLRQIWFVVLYWMSLKLCGQVTRSDAHQSPEPAGALSELPNVPWEGKEGRTEKVGEGIWRKELEEWELEESMDE